MKKFLLFIKKIFYKIGIDIKFVKSNNNNNPPQHNTLHEFEEFFGSANIKKIYLDEARLKFYKWLISLIKTRNIELQNKTIVDIGCGPAKLFDCIDKEFNNVKYYGYDYSEEALKLAKTIFPKAEYQIYDIYENSEKTFDCIICTEVLEHLLYPHTALKNLAKMMTDNSVMIITVPDGRTDTFIGHINFWSIQSWEVFLNMNLPEFNIDFGIEGHHLYAIVKKILTKNI